MGDLQAWLPHQIGVLADDNQAAAAPAAAQPLNPLPSEITEDSWRAAERATQGVIETIQATVVSEKRRQQVVDHMQRFLRYHLNLEVFAFGSVPLKTYLPDGDIDLTALGYPNTEDVLATNVRHVLEMEEQNNDAEFEVKDVQYINAEVKLVKCLVRNIVVDISFNQTGGLTSLCFLEKVDRLIGKDHLFKRSIILIKAWCYYESRILGAHHGLISTYALEMLVLYIFHLFHSSLDGPLAVLYRFLDYYSKFDWDSYCISLHGPVLASSLPELVAVAPENDGANLLFTKEYLKTCVDDFSIPPRSLESTSRNFPRKHLNIVDPLKENNNLGRSVSRGNFYRIRSAFSYGARKLGRVLLLSSESIPAEVNMFFANTLDRHGSGERPDVQGEILDSPESTSVADSPPSELQATYANGELCEQMNTIRLSGLEKENGSRVESNRLVDGMYSLGSASKVSGSSKGREKSKLPISTTDGDSLPNGKACHIPHLFFHSENGFDTGRASQAGPSFLTQGKSVSSNMPISSNAEVAIFPQSDACETESSISSASMFSTYTSLISNWNTEQLENSHTEDGLSAVAGRDGASGSFELKRLADLTGDYGLHTKNLVYVQWSQEYIYGLVPVFAQSPSYQYGNKNSWDPSQRRGAFSHVNTNGVIPGPPFSPSGTYGITSPFVSGSYGIEELPKPRGTGTYFPNTNYHGYKERNSPGRGKNTVAGNHFSRHRNNGRPETTRESNSEEKGGHVLPPQLQLPVSSGNGRGKTAMSDMSNSVRPSLKETSPSNSLAFSSERELEFGSFGPVPLGLTSPEPVRKLDPAIPRTQGSGLTVTAATFQRPLVSSNRERPPQGYQLKDEGDFPPLSG